MAVPSGTVPLADARRILSGAHLYAYVAAKQDGLVIVNVTRPAAPQVYRRLTFDGQLNDAEDVIVGSRPTLRSSPMSPTGGTG